jgi:hypothetical protein
VHNFVAHVDGPPEFGERTLDDFDGSVHASTKTTRFRQDDFLG